MKNGTQVKFEGWDYGTSRWLVKDGDEDVCYIRVSWLHVDGTVVLDDNLSLWGLSEAMYEDILRGCLIPGSNFISEVVRVYREKYILFGFPETITKIIWKKSEIIPP